MHAQKTQLSDTRIKLDLTADQALLDSTLRQVLQRLKREVKLPGFRSGHVPLELVQKNLDPSLLQSEFLDAAMNQMYGAALQEQAIRPVAQPKVELKKFVPYTTLEFSAEIDIVGAIELPDYQNFKLARPEVSITDEDVEQVISNLQLRMADKQDVDRAAKDGDELWIDFAGKDAASGEPVKGADGKDYPLVLGSNTFIPGFEPELLGVKAGEERTFTLTFPKDYAVSALQGRKIIFDVQVKKVQQVVKPELDDAFAAQVGPFKTIDELRDNIRQQVTADRRQQADRDYESQLLAALAKQATVAVPDALVDEELERLEQEERQNVVYRGQTWQEHLDAEGVTEAQHREKNRPGALERVRAGLVLAEIADKERVSLSPEEFERRLQLLKGQYQDPAMQAELDKPENKRELASRMLSEATIAKLVGYASSNSKQLKNDAPQTPKTK